MTREDRLYEAMYRIRRFEETVLENYPKGMFHGTTHLYIGQEANAVGVLSDIQSQDIVVSNHRCHGHYLAYGGEPKALFAELMGKDTGVCAGRGGSQHVHWRNFYANGVLGGTIPIATGMAVAEKMKGTDAIAIAFLGDGTLGQGVVYEALNMASLWNVPILYVVEDNQIAQTTPKEIAIAGDILKRFGAFGIAGEEIDSSDVMEIQPLVKTMIATLRTESQPQALVINTCRFGPHSKGDDTRDPKTIEAFRKTRDPLSIHGARLSDAERERIETVVESEIMNAFEEALADPVSAFESVD